jgi:hypothetical protein
MHHLTITTGDTRWSPRDEVDQRVLALCQDAILPALLAGQRARIPRSPAYYLTGGMQAAALAVTCWVDEGTQRIPIVTWWIAGDQVAASIWDTVILPHCRRMAALHPGSSMPTVQRPASTPWVAAWLEVGSAIDPTPLVWIADLERCLAWAWIDHLRQEHRHGPR